MQLVGRKRQSRHHRVHPMVEQRSACLVPIQVRDLHIGVGMLAAQLANRRGDDQARCIADRDAARLGGGLGLRRGLSGRAQQRFGSRQEHFAGLCEPGALRGAIQQPDAELLLEAPDLPAQRRLRDPQRRRGATEVPVFGHHHEVPDQSQVQVECRRCRFGHAPSVTMTFAVLTAHFAIESDDA